MGVSKITDIFADISKDTVEAVAHVVQAMLIPASQKIEENLPALQSYVREEGIESFKDVIISHAANWCSVGEGIAQKGHVDAGYLAEHEFSVPYNVEQIQACYAAVHEAAQNALAALQAMNTGKVLDKDIHADQNFITANGINMRGNKKLETIQFLSLVEALPESDQAEALSLLKEVGPVIGHVMNTAALADQELVFEAIGEMPLSVHEKVGGNGRNVFKYGTEAAEARGMGDAMVGQNRNFKLSAIMGGQVQAGVYHKQVGNDWHSIGQVAQLLLQDIDTTVTVTEDEASAPVSRVDHLKI